MSKTKVFTSKRPIKRQVIQNNPDLNHRRIAMAAGQSALLSWSHRNQPKPTLSQMDGERQS